MDINWHTVEIATDTQFIFFSFHLNIHEKCERSDANDTFFSVKMTEEEQITGGMNIRLMVHLSYNRFILCVRSMFMNKMCTIARMDWARALALNALLICWFLYAARALTLHWVWMCAAILIDSDTLAVHATCACITWNTTNWHSIVCRRKEMSQSGYKQSKYTIAHRIALRHIVCSYARICQFLIGFHWKK